MGLQSGGLHLGTYSLWAPIVDLGNHSLDWAPTVWGPTSGGLQSPGYRFWISGTTPTVSGPPILDLGGQTLVLKKHYTGPFNVDVV